MAPGTFRWAIGAVKDQTSIGIAKVVNSTALSDLDVAIVKATKHDEYPSEEKYIREILSLTCYSRVFINACVRTLARRLNKTKNWIVALKTLILIQRLLSEGDPSYESEIFFATRRGTRLLNLSDFRDKSHANSWDYSSFVRTYALYLNDRLEFRMQTKRQKHSTFDMDDEKQCKEKDKSTAPPVEEMKIQKIFSRTQHFQNILERFLACRPTGAAKNHRIVIVALYPIVRESFQIYSDITETLDIMLDRFSNLEVSDCVKVYDIFCRVGKQFDELDMFYGWCKSIGVARFSEYPEIEKITTQKLDIMDHHIKEKIDSFPIRTVKAQAADVKNEITEEVEKEGKEEDMNSIKALPPPEGFFEEPFKAVPEEEPVREEKAQQYEVADLLNLDFDVPSHEEHADSLALALFDGAALESAPPSTNPWDCFTDTSDWETALVQSASNLKYQRASLGGGFDMLLLDGMYRQGETARAIAGTAGYGVTGSLSSVAMGSAGRPAMLALPAPPTVGATSADNYADPFTSSLQVAPPAYVQIAEMERKQRLLMEEQAMWQQYAREGMQGQVTQVAGSWHCNSYMAGFPQTYGNYH